jgi:hypothetical protein
MASCRGEIPSVESKMHESGCTINAQMSDSDAPAHRYSFLFAMAPVCVAPSVAYGNCIWHLASAETAFAGHLLYWDPIVKIGHHIARSYKHWYRKEDGVTFPCVGDFASTFQTIRPEQVVLEDAATEGEELPLVDTWEEDALYVARWVVRVTDTHSRVRLRCNSGVALRGCELTVRRLIIPF